MQLEILEKYTSLLIHYCMELQAGERLLVNTTTLAEPLVSELYKQCLEAGIVMDVIFDFDKKQEYFNCFAKAEQAAYISSSYEKAMREFEGFLVIRAPYIQGTASLADPEISAIAANAKRELNKIYFERTAVRALKRNLCQFPTQQAANEAGMTLEAYSDFVISACFLNDPYPGARWLQVRKDQQEITDLMNSCTHFRYKKNDFEISFNTQGRKWINSDGQTNMPSGEIYTSPVEDSVQGNIRFSYPSLYQGYVLENVMLQVKDGYITDWSCDNDIHVLDEVFKIPGTRRFGEAAVGTNYRIDRMTRNILFDEKIGGTVHMAIGQSYLQCNGKNESTLHWDMITDMTQGGQIWADEKLIYENGRFIGMI